MTGEKKFTALVLAGDRGPDDPLLKAAGVPGKALIEIGGKIMLERVVDALLEAKTIDRILVSGPPKKILEGSPALRKLLARPRVSWQESGASPSRSAEQAFKQIPATDPILLTTADHALLQPEMVDFFCRTALEIQTDLAVGMEDYRILQQAFPESRRTVTRFQDGAYCTCNLFAFLSPESRRAAHFWQQVEQQRKKPLRLISLCGWPTVLRFLLGRLTLDDAIARLARRMGLTARAVRLPFAEAAIDVDKPADLELVRRIVADRAEANPGPGLK
jgi:GTP:adenosylcobinamide-phosphate guanylyltransferase